MELLLKNTIEHLGKTGDVVDVKPGYARNYLLPRGMAVMVTKSNIAEVELARKNAIAEEEARLADLKDKASKLGEVSITIEGGPGLDTSSDPLAGGAGGADAAQPGLGNLCSVFCSLMPCGACCCGDHDVSAPGAGDTTGGFIPKIKTHQKILRLKGTEVRATVDEITDAVEQNQMFVNSGGIGMF